MGPTVGRGSIASQPRRRAGEWQPCSLVAGREVRVELGL